KRGNPWFPRWPPPFRAHALPAESLRRAEPGYAGRGWVHAAIDRTRAVTLNASGCLDALTAPHVARALDAFVTKTVTPLPRAGNPPVRIAETDTGMINSIGLANPGREAFL